MVRRNIPLDQKLYARVIVEAKKKFLVWRSAYASGWVVRTYKERGGRYQSTGAKGPLDRWYREQWVDVCHYAKTKTIKPCGRKRAAWDDDYPYCRPLKRITPQTPVTLDELVAKEGLRGIRQRCEEKKRSPAIRVQSLIK